jgi:hypothetical protein
LPAKSAATDAAGGFEAGVAEPRQQLPSAGYPVRGVPRRVIVGIGVLNFLETRPRFLKNTAIGLALNAWLKW